MLVCSLLMRAHVLLLSSFYLYAAEEEMRTVLQDLKFGLRVLARNPGFTAVAIITLALGIGATTAVFSVVNAILLRPLPYPHPDRLMTVWETEPSGPYNLYPASGPDFVDWREHNNVFSSVAAGTTAGAALTGGAEPMLISGYGVSPELFRVLGVQPLLGRLFTAGETVSGHDHLVILSYGLWQRAFGGQRSIVGKTITLDGQAWDVAGVMPQNFKFPPIWGQKADFWKPLNLRDQEWKTSRGNHWLFVIGRLKPGVTIAGARSAMETLSLRLSHQYPDTNTGVVVKVVTLRHWLVKHVKPALLVLFVAVGFLLLIACANVASLLLAKAVGRQREVAIRLAVGSGRARLIRQLLTESVLLFMLGGAAGLAVGVNALRLLLYAVPAGYLPANMDVRFGGWVFLFTLAIAFVTGAAAGLIPAMRASKLDLQGALKEGSRSVSSSHHGARSVMTAVEIALAVVVLIGAGLALRSLLRLLGIDQGFDPHHVLTAHISLPEAEYSKPAQVSAFYEQALQRIRALPGVESAAAASELPLEGYANDVVYIEGQPIPKNMWSSPLVNVCRVTPGYFKTMHIPLIKGRDFTLDDGPKSPKVAIINEAMAHLFWRNQNPVGMRFTQGYSADPQWITVVGVVGDVREYGIGEPPPPEAYFPHEKDALTAMQVVIRTATPPLSEADAVRRVIHSLDSQLPFSNVRTLDQVVSNSSQQQKFVALLLGLFAALALILAAVGIYGVISFSVAQRTHEFGVRMALGAQKDDVLRLVMRRGFFLAAVGVAAGVVAALGLTRLMASLLYGITPTDPLTFVVVSCVLLAVALIACYLPARRATRVDPNIALRCE